MHPVTKWILQIGMVVICFVFANVAESTEWKFLFGALAGIIVMVVEPVKRKKKTIKKLF